MKKYLLMAFAALLAILSISSCTKGAGNSHYTFNMKYHVSSNSDFSSINSALGDRYNTQYNTESQARKEWKLFLSAVNDSEVLCAADDYYEVALVKMGIEGDSFVVLKTLEKVRWDESGRHSN